MTGAVLNGATIANLIGVSADHSNAFWPCGCRYTKKKRREATHDYKHNGTTTLFAALGVLAREVFGRSKQRHQHQEFIRFLNALERDIPVRKVDYVILDD